VNLVSLSIVEIMSSGAIHFQTFGPFFVFLFLSYGVTFRSLRLRSKRGDLDSYKNFNALALHSDLLPWKKMGGNCIVWLLID